MLLKTSQSRYKSSQQQSQDQEDQDYSKKSKKKTKHYKMPRFIKNKIDQNQITQIVLNVSKTQYDVVQKVGQQMKWTLDWSKKSHKWDVMWVDNMIQAHDLFKLNQHQKISHFPSISVLARKDLLGKGLGKLSKVFPIQYDFFPLTWTLPADYNDLHIYNEGLTRQNKKQFFIFKPQASSQGKGIKITDKIQDLQQKSGIVQIYVNQPFLIQGLKFDLRIYVLLAGCDPMRIYIYEEGLGRFATELYKKVKKKNAKQSCMHLTNYAINKNNKNFIFNKSEKYMNQGHKRSLTSIYEYLQKIGADVQKIKLQINDLIVKTIITGQPMLAHIYNLSQPDNYANDICFHILGFDVMLDEKLKPILLEVNHTPSFTADTPLDKFIKKSLIKDTLNLLNVNIQTKKKKIAQKQQFIELRAQNKKIKLTPEEKIELKKKAQQQRNLYENNNLGRYKKLYPIQIPQKIMQQQYQDKQIIQKNDSIRAKLKILAQKYEEILKISKKIFDDHFGFKKKGKTIQPNKNLTTSLRPYSQSKDFKKKTFKKALQQSVQIKKNMKEENLDNQQQIQKEISKTKIFFQKKSFDKLPSIQKQKTTVIMPYVCPTIADVKKNQIPKFKTRDQFFKFQDQKKKNQKQKQHLKGAFLIPKTWELDDLNPNSPKKQKTVKTQQSYVQNFHLASKLSMRKQIYCDNILKILIYKKTNIKNQQ